MSNNTKYFDAFGPKQNNFQAVRLWKGANRQSFKNSKNAGQCKWKIHFL